MQPRRRLRLVLPLLATCALLAASSSAAAPGPRGVAGARADSKAQRAQVRRVSRLVLRLGRRGRKATPPAVPAQPPPPPPAPAPPPPPAPVAGGAAMGVQFHCNWSTYTNETRRQTLDKIAAAGIEWVRIDTSWEGMELDHKGHRNPWYIGMTDFCVDEARKRGLKVLITLWLTPAWANGGQSNRRPPANPQDYADFARWAAGHWKGRVQAWEVWNEPDQSTYWQATFEEYVALLKAAYPGFKAGDLNALVVLGGPSSNDDAWMRSLYALGAGGSFDVLATHPYQGILDLPPEHPDDGNRWWFTHLPAVREVMIANGDVSKQIWFTEFGWSAHENWPDIPAWQRGVTQAEQADYAVRAVRYTRLHWPYVGAMFWYKERAKPGGTDVVQEGYALLDADFTERPVYKALKAYLTG